MKKIDILGIAFGNFRRRKLRSVLTVLGVVIGTASIVTMMSLGIALDKSFSESLGNTANLTTVRVNPGWDETTGQQKGNLDDELVAQLSALANVEGVSPQIQLSGKMFSGKYQSYAQIIGVDFAYSKQLGIDKLAVGAGMTEETISSGKNIYALFSAEAPYQFAKPQRSSGGSVMYMGGGYYDPSSGEERPPPDVDVMSEDTRIKYTYDWSYGENYPGEVKKKAVLYNIKPVGVLEGGNYDSSVYIDIETAKRLKKEMDKFNSSQQGGSNSKKQNKQTYDTLLVFSDNMENTIALADEINAMGFNARSDAQWISQSKEMMGLVQMLLGGIGSISLLVAAIGITNTMIMSIYERTREIGIMKVIGCYLKDIRTMFLIEAGFIGFFGGLVGVILSYGLSVTMNWLVKSGGGSALGGMGLGGGGSDISVIPPWLALLAVGFAILVALISGFLPARRAMKLSALEAMRT